MLKLYKSAVTSNYYDRHERLSYASGLVNFDRKRLLKLDVLVGLVILRQLEENGCYWNNRK